MNMQLVISWLAKLALVLGPIMVAAGWLSQEQVDAIIGWINQLPDVVVQIMSIVTFVAGIYSMIRSWITHKPIDLKRG